VGLGKQTRAGLRTREITLSIESQFGNVPLIGLALSKIASYASASKQEISEMEVAVVEAVNNAVEHAHHHRREKLVTVRVRLSSDRIRFTVIDSGPSIDFKAALAVSAALENATEIERGRGLKIIRSLMDEVKYERKGETNQVTLVKYLKRS
jgi:serine/threonine-protein kinase RsbW